MLVSRALLMLSGLKTNVLAVVYVRRPVVQVQSQYRMARLQLIMTNVRRLLLAVTLCISVATAMVGPISFLGLIIANLSRQMLKTYRHTQLILGSALFGMIGLILGQLIVERVFIYAIPVSVFITVGGGIYFLYLLLAGKRA